MSWLIQNLSTGADTLTSAVQRPTFLYCKRNSENLWERDNSPHSTPQLTATSPADKDRQNTTDKAGRLLSFKVKACQPKCNPYYSMYVNGQTGLSDAVGLNTVIHNLIGCSCLVTKSGQWPIIRSNIQNFWLLNMASSCIAQSHVYDGIWLITSSLSTLKNLKLKYNTYLQHILE